MAERKVKATDKLLWLQLAGDPVTWQMVRCLTQVAVNTAIEEIQSKTFCGTSSEPGDVTIEVPFQGEIVLDSEVPAISDFELSEMARAKTKGVWKIEPAVPVAGDVTHNFEGWLSQNDMQAQIGNNTTFSGNIKVDVDTYEEVKFVAAP